MSDERHCEYVRLFVETQLSCVNDGEAMNVGARTQNRVESVLLVLGSVGGQLERQEKQAVTRLVYVC